MIKKQILKKQEKVEHITRSLNKSSAVVFYNFSHADNNEIFLLKKKLREVKSEWFVCKNVLFRRALSRENLQISGNNAFVFCNGDQYEPLKVLKNFGFRKNLEGRIRGAIYNGNFVDHQTLASWAVLKSRKALLNDFCSLLISSVFDLTTLLGALITSNNK